MIATNGKLFQNGNKNNYVYSESLLTTDFSDALEQINFDIEKFDSRYRSDHTDLILKRVLSKEKIA